MGPQYTFSLEIRGSAVDVILFTNPTAAFYASAHTHSGHEFHYIREGSSNLRIGSDNYAMLPGNCYLVARETFHDIRMCSADICRIGALIIPGSHGGIFGKLPPCVTFKAEGELQQILELLLSALRKGQTPDFETYARACLTMLLTALLEKLTPETADDMVEKILDRVHELDMTCGGTFDLDHFDLFVVTGRIHTEEEKRKAELIGFIKAFPGMKDLKAGDFVDAWYSPIRHEEDECCCGHHHE